MWSAISRASTSTQPPGIVVQPPLPQKKEYVDEEIQTTICVYPAILDYGVTARVCSERRCQTQISVGPDQENRTFYSMLQYMPFQDLQEGSMRVMNLPRKMKLQFDHSPLARLHLNRAFLMDDDGICELCIDLEERLRQSTKKGLMDFTTQTESRFQLLPSVRSTHSQKSLFRAASRNRLSTQTETGSSHSRSSMHSKKSKKNKNVK